MSKKKPDWLNAAVFYEIYPQSFYDSNADGIGDIKGIIEKLDYVQYLGCNAIWLNPIYESSFYDAGYDVVDYYKVAARYGTNADLKRFFKEAHKRGIKVCLDFVPGHTAVDHPWFQQSCKHEKNKYSNRYVWTDNPWEKANHGLRLVHGFGQRKGNYAANFFWNQPALNYGFASPDPKCPWQLPTNHPDVKATIEEMENIMRFWLDMGADGFRVDMAQSLVKNDDNWVETSKIWKKIRTMLENEYEDKVLISEWSKPSAAIKAGFHVDFLLAIYDNCYSSLFRQETKRDLFGRREGNSFFDKKGKGDITEFLKVFSKEQKAIQGKGYVSIPSGNHDITRISMGRSKKELEVVFAFILTVPGVPFIYYGDEIGMKYVAGMPSKEGAYGRTGSRTPMQWSSGRNSGFSKAPEKKLYLPVQDSMGKLNVEVQSNSKASLLNLVRTLIEMRHSSPALQADGKLIPVYAEPGKYPFIYKRKKGREEFIIIVNPANRCEEATCECDLSEYRLVLGRKPEIQKAKNGHAIRASPISYSILKRM